MRKAIMTAGCTGVLLTVGSVAALGADPTEAAVVRPDHPARGRPELDDFVVASWKARMKAFDTTMSITPLEIVVAGTWAYSRGVHSQDLTAKETG
jgi:hypothetical protein